MTEDASVFTEVWKQNSSGVTFGGNGPGNILGIGTDVKNSTSSIENVHLTYGLKYNLLSILQLCDKGYRIWFDDS